MTVLALVPFAPFIAALLIAALGRRLPACGGWLAVAGTGVAAVALPFFHGMTIDAGIAWFTLGPWHFTLSLHLDGLSWWLATLVAWVALAVDVYAVGFMRPEEGRVRFHAWMAFFAASMLTLVLAGSFLLLFLAWEGVGVASFALIAQRHNESEARRAALKALLMTRIGDFGLLLGWLLALHYTGTTDIAALLGAVQAGQLPEGTPLLLAMLFLAAALGKSAQLPLTAWLPDAMAGPTPVSALIHSATMVAAGVYLVTRLFPLFAAAPPALDVVLWIGGVTAVFAALAASAQADLKRILAWSTVSQLGEMFIALGLGAPIAATLHLTTHAAFKACLFLGAGLVERAVESHELARLGSLYRRLPWAAAAFVAAALALAGVPPFSGYWSEARILDVATATRTGWAIVLLVLIALAGVYIGRAAMATFGPWREAGPNIGCREAGRDAAGREAKRDAARRETERNYAGRKAGRDTAQRETERNSAGREAERDIARRRPLTMLVPTFAFAGAALALGWLVKDPIGRVLRFAESSPSSNASWTAAEIATSLAGLAFGVWRARRGPSPAFGDWARRLSLLVHRIAGASNAGLAAGSALLALERGYDLLAQGGVAAALVAARGTRAGERGLDRLGRSVAQTAWAAAQGARFGEDRGLWVANQTFAQALGAAGAQLKRIESGRIFLYSAGVFVFTLAAGITIVLIAWLI